MNDRKNQNSILVLATLGVYLGLVLVGATPQVLAQAKPVADTAINKKPLNDFAKVVSKKIENKEVDPTASFTVKFEVFLIGGGTFDTKRSKVVQSDGDPALVEIVKDGISAIGESGYFQYLRDLGIDQTNLTVSQDNQNFSISIQSETKTKERARSIVSMLNTMIHIGKVQAKNENDKLMLEGTTVASDQSTFAINVVIPHVRFHQMVRDTFSNR